MKKNPKFPAKKDDLKNDLAEKEKNNQVIYFNNLHIDIWINDKPVKMFLILVIHWPSTFIIGYSFNSTDSSETILHALVKSQENIKKYDLDRSFLSPIVSNFMADILTAITSDSRTTIKFNQITKCVNRWIKHEFIIIYDDQFKSWKEFAACLAEYIDWKNIKDIRLKTGTTRLASIKVAVMN